MTTHFTRAGLLVLVGTLSLSAASAPPASDPQPAPKNKVEIIGLRKEFTAFPDIKAPTVERKEVTKPDGTIETVIEERGVVPLPAMPTIAADAPLLRKVKYEQLQEGLAYINRVKDLIQRGAWSAQFFTEYMEVIAQVYLVASELEDKLEKRILWHEARVREYKTFEKFMHIRVLNGTDPPSRLHLVRFQRLQTEADLLKLKAEVDKAGGK